MQEYRQYQIKAHAATPNVYIIVTAGRGGKIPNVLDGMFTSRQVAIDAIDYYLDNKTTKES